MGNYTSKLFFNNINHEIKIDDQFKPESRGNMTPLNAERKFQLDPRSLTNEITRTPIEVNYTPRLPKRWRATPKYMQYERKKIDFVKNNTDIDLESNTGELLLESCSASLKYPKPIFTQDPLHIGWSNKQSNTLHPQQQINILDPRSPASGFDRTPVILRVKTFDCQNSISPEHLSKVKEINSKLDIHFKLSYCETVSPFSITEIQALPDIVINLKRSCSVNAKLDKYILSTNNETTNIDSAESNSESNNESIVSSQSTVCSMLTPKFIPEFYINEGSFGTVCECQELLNSDNQETYCDIFNNVFSTNRFMQHANQCTHAEEKFTVWKDENSSEIPSNIFVYKPNYVAKIAKTICETEKSLIQSDDNILMNSMKNNPNKRIKKSNGKMPEDIERKEIKETKKEKIVMDEKVLFSLNYGNAAKVLKNRTPLANRSNSNGKIQSLVTDSPQNIVRNKVLPNKVLQENTPPIKKKSVKNDTSTFDSTNWNSNSTFII